MTRERQPCADGNAGDDEAGKEDKADDADGPAEPDNWDQLLEDDGQNDAAARATSGSEPDCKRAPLLEPVPEDGDGGVEPKRKRRMSARS